jgi:laccase
MIYMIYDSSKFINIYVFAIVFTVETFKVPVEPGKIYLLRVINAAMNTEFFFAVSGHSITVVGTDGSYTKPYLNEYIMIAPGQTMDLLLHANQFKNSSSPYRYYIIAAPFFDGSAEVSRDSTVTSAILEYKTKTSTPPVMPVCTLLPSFNDTGAAAAFTSGLRSLGSSDYPVDVPKTVDVKMYITISLNEQLCPNSSCSGINGTRFASSLNNASFETPIVKIDVLDAYYKSIAGVYTTDFPDQPPLYFNFTGSDIPEQLYFVDKSTKVKVLEYNTTVEIVFQGTNILGAENHPMHLHGHSFYVVGSGFGNFDNRTDPLSYNLVDPPYQNTVGVMKNGWATIRFRAANPGVIIHFSIISISNMKIC